jgi:ankyrin repeat protein
MCAGPLTDALSFACIKGVSDGAKGTSMNAKENFLYRIASATGGKIGKTFALAIAAAAGDADAVIDMQKAGADIHAGDDAFLLEAVEAGRTESVAVLLKAGANVNARHGKALPLAAEKGYTEIVRMLLKAGADVNAIRRDLALTVAEVNGHEETVKVLKDWIARDTQKPSSNSLQPR